MDFGLDFRLLLSVGAVLLFVSLFMTGYAVLMSRPSLSQRIGHGESEGKRDFSFLQVLRRSEKVFKPLGEMLPRSPEEMTRQEKLLVQAGIRRRDSPYIFYGIKVALVIAFFIAFSFTGMIKDNPILFILLPILLGALIPDYWLRRRIRIRQEHIQQALPDALDLAVVCVEAGLGLDQSLQRIGKELHSIYPDLSDELNLYGLEVNAGRQRVEALRHMGERTQVDDLKAFIAVLVQTDRFGTSVAQSLRVFADTMRTKRRQRAEERAAKMNIKMIPPLVFFIFPAIFVVIMGPAVIAIARNLIPALTGQ
jgi:tight adherence protein C